LKFEVRAVGNSARTSIFKEIKPGPLRRPLAADLWLRASAFTDRRHGTGLSGEFPKKTETKTAVTALRESIAVTAQQTKTEV
jgi:hypothetical protein